VTASGYTVTVNYLTAAAHTFLQQCENVLTAKARFQVAASDVSERSFGNLPESQTLWQQFQKFVSQVDTDLSNLASSLLAISVTLTASAINYELAENANTVR
jgi:hypothetical protein